MGVLAVVTLVLGGVVAAQALGWASTEVVREPVATAGANPFMPPLGADAVDVTPVANAGGTHSGATAGLFGGSGDDTACDRAALGRFLEAHPDRATGWASVLGLRVGDVDRYLEGLTPVLLRSDTFVTNHGWVDGAVTSYPAVLQAGTAVLVDSYGNPVTRCSCGNPLSAPVSYDTVAYVGPVWTSFSSTSITVVSSSTTVVNDYTIVDVHSGDGHARPRGSDGDDDEPVDVGSLFGPASGTTAGGTGAAGAGETAGGGTDAGDDVTGGAVGEDGGGAEGAEGDAAAAGSDASGEDLTGDAGGAAGESGDTGGTGDATTPVTGSTPGATSSSSAVEPAAGGLAGTTWTAAGSSCGTLSGASVTLAEGSTFTAGGSSGTWASTGDELTLTETSDAAGTTPMAFTQDGDGWSMTGGGCTLTAA